MRPLVSLFAIFAVFSAVPALAQNTSLDFETRPNSPYPWVVGPMTSGFSGWTFAAGNAEISREQSVSGDQSLKFTTTGTADLTHSLSNLGGGGRFLDLTLRLPVAKTLVPGSTPAWPVGEAQLVLDALPAMVAKSGSSPTAQLFIYSEISGVGTWSPVGPALELDDGGLNLKRWLRLSVRTDMTNQVCDLWMDTRLTTINRLPAPSAGGSFLLRSTAGQVAFVDDFVSGDSNPLYVDSDRDGMPDLYEYENQLDPSVNDRNGNKDSDSLTNITEYWLGTKINLPDSDGDGMPDDWEYNNGLNPLSAADKLLDLDLDGFTNFEEYTANTNPTDVNATVGAVVYVKAGVVGAQLGTFAAPFTTVQAALDAVPAGGRIALLGSGGNITGTGNQNLAVSKPVTIVGRQGANLVGAGGYALYTTFPPSSGPLTVEDLSFSGFNSSNDGSAVYSDQVPVVLRRCRFQNCTAADDGGAVFVNGASLVAEDCTFENCVSTDKGGALYTEFVGNASITRCRFLSCHSTLGDGCAVYFRQTGGTFQNNLVWNCTTTTSGRGAIACVEGTTVAFSWCTLLSNRGTTVTGGIYNGNTTGSISLNSCILNDNKYSTTLSQLNGTAWTINYCAIQGAIWPGTGNNSYANSIFIPNTPMLNSSSAGLRGDLTGSAPLIDITGTVRNTYPEKGCYEFDDADQDGMPTAWELKYGLNPKIASDANADLDQDGYTNLEEFLRNSDPSIAASADILNAIFVDPVVGKDANSGFFGTPVESISKAISLISTTRYRVCLANGTYSGPLNRNITLAAGSPSSVLIKSLNGFEAVTINLQNSGRFLTTTTTASIKFLTIRNGFTTGSGGAILFKGYIDSCRFIACKAALGGAIYSNAANITFSQFTGCEATQSGGAIAGIGGFILSANTFSYNSAALQGGACYLETTVTTSSSGGIGAGTGSLDLKQCVFYRNNAREGGALSLLNCTVRDGTWNGVSANIANKLTGCNFTENVARSPAANAASHGGAVLITNSMTDFNTCSFRNNSVAANGTGSATGGAIYFVSGDPRIFGSTFVANEAAKEGGAFRINAGAPQIVNCALSENLAGAAGGAVSVKAATAPTPAPIATIAYSTLVYNRSPKGPSIYYGSDTNLYNSLSWFNVFDPALDPTTHLPLHAELEGVGATLTAQGNNLTLSKIGNVSIQPTLAFDNYHLVGPLPPASPSILGTASPDYSTLLGPVSGYTNILNDIDAETRGFGVPDVMESGCDEWLDTDSDGLPDWFEKYIMNYSGRDALSISSMASVTPGLKLLNSQWTLLEIFQYGGNPLVTDNAQADNDSDGLSNIREAILGTNKNDSDTDGDGLPDGWEVAHGTNPLVPDGNEDPDDDGLTNLQEYLYATDPQNHDTDGDGIWDGVEISQGSDPHNAGDQGQPKPASEQIGIGLNVADISSSKSEIYDLVVCEVKDDGSDGTEVYRLTSLANGASNPKVIYSLDRDKAYSFRLDWQSSTFGPSKADYDYVMDVSVVSPEGGGMICDEEPLLGTYTGTQSENKLWNDGQKGIKPPDVGGDGETGSGKRAVYYFPVQILDMNKKRIKNPKVAKMVEPDVITGSGDDARINPDKDPDRYYVRVIDPVHRAKGGGAKARLWTVGKEMQNPTSPAADYSDPPNNTLTDDLLDLEIDPSHNQGFISKSFLLVSNDVDDDSPIDSVADDALNDRTRKINLGGDVKVEYLCKENVASGTMHTKAMVKTDGEVHITSKILLGTGFDAEFAKMSLQKTREFYFQTGILVVLDDIAEVAIPTGVSLFDEIGFTDVTFNPSTQKIELSNEAKSLFSVLGTDTAEDIIVFYLNRIDGGDAEGISTPIWHKAHPLGKDAENVVIAREYKLEVNQQPANQTVLALGRVAAHEIGHVLGMRHQNQNIRLMIDGDNLVQADVVNGSVRISTMEEQDIKTKSPHFKKNNSP